jgi:hypothetical protein
MLCKKNHHANNCLDVDDATMADVEMETDAGDKYALFINQKNDPRIMEKLEFNPSISLANVKRSYFEALRKLKIRSLMKINMTASGTHSNEAWNFIEAAMKDFSGYSKIGIYYFCMRCEEHVDIECNFITFLDEKLKGDTTSPDSPEINKKKRGKGDDTTAFIKEMVGHSNEMVAILKDSVNDRKIALKSEELDCKKAASD